MQFKATNFYSTMLLALFVASSVHASPMNIAERDLVERGPSLSELNGQYNQVIFQCSADTGERTENRRGLRSVRFRDHSPIWLTPRKGQTKRGNTMSDRGLAVTDKDPGQYDSRIIPRSG